MSPRTGRPKTDNPKSNDIKVRVNSDTMQRLDAYCEKKGITRAEYQLNKNATKLFAMYAVVKPNIVPGTAKINP